MNNKILIVLIHFFETNILDECLNSLQLNIKFLKEEKNISCDVIILENKSINSNKSRQIISRYDFIKHHYLSEENIEGHIISKYFLKTDNLNLTEYDYLNILVSNVIQEKKCLTESISILEKYNNFKICSVYFDPITLSNEKKTWKLGKVKEDYIKGSTGIQSITFKINFFSTFIKKILNKEIKSSVYLGSKHFNGFSDSNLKLFLKRNNIPWVRNKNSFLIKKKSPEYIKIVNDLIKNKSIRQNISNNKIKSVNMIKYF